MSNQTEKFEEYKLVYNFINPNVPLKGWINEENYSNLYAKDWNDLMEVVEKIESLGYNFQITSKDATVLQNHGAIYLSLIYKVDGLNKIEATHQTVVEFIKWHNKQNS